MTDGRRPVLVSLEVYRGLAALFVVLFHVTVYARERHQYQFLDGIFSFGYTGVDFFFVLSGFIIAYAHWSDVGRKDRVRPYLLRRLVRIYPLYVLVTLVKAAVIYASSGYAKPYERDAVTIVKSLLLLPQPHLPTIGVAWTLSYEVLFYLVFALIIYCGVYPLRHVLALWAMAIVAAASLPPLSPWTAHYVGQFLFNERLLEFAAGVLGALVLGTLSLRVARVMAVSGALLYAAAAATIAIGRPPFSHAVLFGLPAALLIVGSAASDRIRPWRLPGALRYLGASSYALYLTHAMFVTIAVAIMDRLAWWTYVPLDLALAALVGAAVLGGALLHQWLERPLLSRCRAWIAGNRRPHGGLRVAVQDAG